MRAPVVFIMGATAAGKTELAIRLFDRVPCELINVDSAQVYRELNVGAAKPSAQVLERYPHHLMDIRDPSEVYNVGDFRRDAMVLIEEIHQRRRVPVLVGGTMMYFKALLDDMADLPEGDARVRADIEALAAADGWPAVHRALQQVDPEMAAQIHPNHSQRVSRALEVYRISGVTMTEWRRRQQLRNDMAFTDKFDVLQYSLALLDRKQLHERIRLRFEAMLANGLVGEVKALQARGDLYEDLPAIRAVGYRQVWQYLRGEMNYADMVEAGVVATRQLAKRQLTWLRNWGYPLLDLPAEQPAEALSMVLSEVAKREAFWCAER